MSDSNKSLEDIFGEAIFVYTRADALRDGVLIDVTDSAKEAGWKFPVAVNDNAWAHIVPSDEVKAQFGCDEKGRLHDVLWMAMLKARSTTGPEILFDVILPQKVHRSRVGLGATETVKFKALCHPGDNMEPVVTIMMPND